MRRLVIPTVVIGIAVAAIVIAQATRSAESPEEPTKIVQMVPLGLAETARIDGRLGSGSLRLAGGTVAGAGRPLLRGELLRAEFTNADAAAPPTISTGDANDTRRVRLVQDDEAGLDWTWDQPQRAWSLFLNPTVPTSLHLEVGAGDAEIALGGLSLTDFAYVNGAGDTTLDFTGDWPTGLDASIRLGAGDLTLRLPRHVGVRVEIDQVAGDVDADEFTEQDGFYTNDAYGEATVNLTIKIDQGAGDIDLELAN